ncbi:fumarylacetoacetate hydrolase family protein [Streptomyces sp. NPDC020996]|uniref:fumarylacetoacetate hydrolase family protein n=1 Tax=Streptomyces sp. NPDC020996 TaxID=3154791 RepID=UPI00340BA306
MSEQIWHNLPAGGFGFARYLGAQGPDIALVVDGDAYPLSATGIVDGPVAALQALLGGWDDVLDALQKWVGAGRRTGVTPLDLRRPDVLPPVEPLQIFQAAANYRKHVIDLMVASPRPEHVHEDEARRREIATALMDQRAASGTPTVFAGMPTSVTGPYSDVVIPRITAQCDWELELAVVMGQRARYVSATDAMSYVAGYTIVNDVTMRDWLYPTGDSSRGADWLACKGAPTFLPLGPLVVPARFVPDPTELMITLTLNGTTMQHESAADMIFGIPRLIEHTSRFAELRAGDVLLTGSPAGNGVHHGRFLRDGDVMTGAITGLGVQETPVTEENPVRP